MLSDIRQMLRGEMMLYLPESNFLFLHIPRSAGCSITRAIVREVLDYQEMIYVTWHNDTLRRHAPARRAIRSLGLQRSKVQLWAVHRDQEELIASDYQLWRSIRLDLPNGDPQFRQKLRAAHRGEQSFRRFWNGFLQGQTIWQFWTQGMDVHRIEFTQLDKQWPDVAKAAGCRQIPKLPFKDYQREKCDAM